MTIKRSTESIRQDRVDALENDSRLENIVRTVEAYAEAVPNTNTAAIEAALLLGAAFASQSAALDRFFVSLGLDRTRGRYGALRVLYFVEGSRMPQHAIASQMNVTSANVTYLIDGLEAEGLVRRQPDKEDRRVTFVELTAEGKELCEKMVPAMVQFMASMTAGFSEEEIVCFRGLLNRFRLNALKWQKDTDQEQ